MSETATYKRHRDAIFRGVDGGMPNWLIDVQESAKQQLEQANAKLPPGVVQAGFRVQTGDEPLEVFIMGSGKHGKSTLINSLMGRYVAPVDVLSKTWCFHRFIAVPKPSSTVSLYMRDISASPLYKHLVPMLGNAVSKPNPGLYEYQVDSRIATKILDGEERKQKEKGSYNSPILEVEWQVPSDDSVLPGLRLVDTQGIDQLLTDINHQVHLEWRYSRADAVIWIVSYENLGDRESLKKMADLRRYERPMIILINRWDEVNDKDKVLSRAKSIYGELAQYVIPVCALQAFLGSKHKGYSLTKQDEFFLEKYKAEHKNKLWENSGITELEDAFRSVLASKAGLQRNVQLYNTIRLAQQDYRRELHNRQKYISALLDYYNRCEMLLHRIEPDIKQSLSALTSAAKQEAINTVSYHIDEITYKTSAATDASTLQFSQISGMLASEFRGMAYDSSRRIQDFITEARQLRKHIDSDGSLQLPDLLSKVGNIDVGFSGSRLNLDASYYISPETQQQIQNELQPDIFNIIQMAKKFLGGWTSTEYEVNCDKQQTLLSRSHSAITYYTHITEVGIAGQANSVINDIEKSIQSAIKRQGGANALTSERNRIVKALSWVAVPTPFFGLPVQIMKKLRWRNRN